MNKYRLLKLVELLEKVNDDKKLKKKFDLTSWVNSNKTRVNESVDALASKGVNYSCGTTACALGWAASDPWFNEQGFHFKVIPNGTFITDNDVVIFYEGEIAFFAAKTFFDLSGYEALELFQDGLYKSPKDNTKISPKRVAKRILKFVETGKIDIDSKIY